VNDIDQCGLDFAALCQAAGYAGFAIRTTENGDLRLIALTLPVGIVCQMLRTAADVYEANSEPETVN
jgi:hypothetical protein